MLLKINNLTIFQDSISKYLTIKSRSMSLVPRDSGFIFIELFLNANMIIIHIYKNI